MSYLLDANVFIQAKNLHYGMDFCPAFWQWLRDHNQSGQVFSIDKVEDELTAGEDELSEWAKEAGESFFRLTGSEVVSQFEAVSRWVMLQSYEPAAINTFLQIADFYLIAHALAGKHAVVTHERPADSRKKIKIPNVCAALNVRCMTPFEMLRHERARFILGR
jgi:hypothetical protein